MSKIQSSQTSSCDRPSQCRKLDHSTCQHRCTSRMDCAAVRPIPDPLAALERARKAAFEEEEAERWDGMA